MTKGKDLRLLAAVAMALIGAGCNTMEPYGSGASILDGSTVTNQTAAQSASSETSSAQAQTGQGADVSASDATAAVGETSEAGSATTDVQPGEYMISNDDVIEVSVYQVADLSRTVQVDGKGNIKLPLIGLVKAAGRSVPDVEADITRLLKAKYLQDPQVTVFLKDAVGQRVTVQGAVAKPGVFPAKGKMTLMQAVAEAGGFSDLADKSAIYIVRQTEKGRVGARFDAEAIKVGNAEDPVLNGGDMVVVDESGGLAAWKRLREATSFSYIAGFLLF